MILKQQGIKLIFSDWKIRLSCNHRAY